MMAEAHADSVDVVSLAWATVEDHVEDRVMKRKKRSLTIQQIEFCTNTINLILLSRLHWCFESFKVRYNKQILCNGTKEF